LRWACPAGPGEGGVPPPQRTSFPENRPFPGRRPITGGCRSGRRADAAAGAGARADLSRWAMWICAPRIGA